MGKAGGVGGREKRGLWGRYEVAWRRVYVCKVNVRKNAQQGDRRWCEVSWIACGRRLKGDTGLVGAPKAFIVLFISIFALLFRPLPHDTITDNHQSPTRPGHIIRSGDHPSPSAAKTPTRVGNHVHLLISPFRTPTFTLHFTGV
jgi:hypothetical protein